MFQKHTTPSSTLSQQEIIALYRQAVASGQSLGEIEKKVQAKQERLGATDRVEQTEALRRETTLKNKLPRIVRLGAFTVPAVFMLAGLYLVGTALFPLVRYYVSTSPQLQAAVLKTPIPLDNVLDGNAVAIVGSSESVIREKPYTGPVFLTTQLDYTNLSNWFDTETGKALAAEPPTQGFTEYTLDIPKLNITNAIVAVGGTDLNQSLIAYPGTALPGDVGAPVIFGHSVLRRFYNPSEQNPRRYNSIFSTIMTLEPGDEIYVTAGGKEYTYRVQDKTEVQPTDVHILAQKYDSKLLKLVTCTPEGTYLRRGVVTAALVEVG
ncbi:MAG: sortase [Pseudomonadales bacterium]|nr:sortase [Candidatus Woesebacteria bacterium]MCB9801694.1 sortase [Pseudomonadales bacterium]